MRIAALVLSSLCLAGEPALAEQAQADRRSQAQMNQHPREAEQQALSRALAAGQLDAERHRAEQARRGQVIPAQPQPVQQQGPERLQADSADAERGQAWPDDAAGERVRRRREHEQAWRDWQRFGGAPDYAAPPIGYPPWPCDDRPPPSYGYPVPGPCPPSAYYPPFTRYGAPAYVVPGDRGSGGWTYGGPPGYRAPPAYTAPGLRGGEE